MRISVAHTVSSIDHLGSGITYCVTGLAKAQAQAGAAPEVFSLGRGTSYRATSYADHRFPNDLKRVPMLNKLGMSVGLRRALCATRPGIVHTHGLWMLPNVYRTAEAAFVISPHGMLAPVALAFSPRKKRLFRMVFQDQTLAAAALFHATAESEYDDIRLFGLRQPVAIIPNGIDLPVPAVAQRSSKTVLSLGRIHPKKALDLLIRAWAGIEPTFPDWRLRIVGPDEGRHAGELAGLVRTLGLTSVSIEPPVFGADKTELMAGADVFVLPSHSENFGMTVAESLAVGVPVISSKGAPWAGLETHGCGWWIDHGPEAMTAMLQTALSLPDAERRVMGARGRRWMARDFSWDRMAELSLQAYAWILGLGDRPDCVRVE
jgi:glycosyltransferase involved in cell wall biosynthesis